MELGGGIVGGGGWFFVHERVKKGVAVSFAGKRRKVRPAAPAQQPPGGEGSVSRCQA